MLSLDKEFAELTELTVGVVVLLELCVGLTIELAISFLFPRR